MIQINHLDHINLNVKNLEKTSGFYQKIFGLKIKEEGTSSSGSPYAIIGDPQSFYLCLYENNSDNINDSLNHIGVHLKNFDEALKKLKDENIEILYGGPVNYPHSRSLYIKDPDGMQIELSEKFGGDLG